MAVDGVDFWSDGKGKIVHDKFLEITSGPKVGVIKSQNNWVAPDGKLVCTDTRTHRFYSRREVKDIISLLRLVHNPADEISLDRVINIPPRGIGDKTLTTLHAVARQTEAGIHRAANYLLNSYVVPGDPSDPLDVYTLTAAPVKYNGQAVVLSSERKSIVGLISAPSRARNARAAGRVTVF